jgi:hypothetical protein
MLARRFVFVSALPPAEVVERLRAATRAPSGMWLLSGYGGFGPAPPKVRFVGEIGETRFELRRDIRYRNSFLPKIRGEISPQAQGTRIATTFGVHPLVLAFMVFWLGLVGTMAFDVAGSAGRSAPEQWLLAGMFVFGLLLYAGGYFPEERIARRALAEIVEATPATAATAA